MALVAVAASAADYRMWIDDFEIKGGETKTVSLNMDNITAVTGFQTDIVLPEGLSIKVDEDDYYAIELTSRATRGHIIDGSLMPDGAVRMIAYTTDLNPFKLNTGAVATITLVASDDFTGTHDIVVRNTELAAADGNNFNPADETCKVFSEQEIKPGDEFVAGGIKYVVNDDAESVVVTYTELDSHDNYKGLTAANIPATVVYNNKNFRVSGIGEKAFKNCDDLASVVLPEGIDSIGRAAFHTCPNLTELNVPASVTWVNIEALRACNNMAKITVAGGNTVYNSANGCNAIVETATKTLVAGCKTTVVPSDTKMIGDYAFAEHDGIETMILPATVDTIGKQAFDSCKGLKSITIPDGTKAIKDMAFRRCYSLESFTIPAAATVIGQGILRECTALKSAKVLSESTAIEDWTFWGCSALTDVNIPAWVKEIKYGAFYQCTALTEVEIPSGVETLGDYAFYGCSSLTKATIPASITTYGKTTFRECNALTDVYAAYETPVAIPATSFSWTTYNNAMLHVPAGCTAAYKATETWKNFAHIQDDYRQFAPGDVNGDGVVNVTDVNLLINIALGRDNADNYNGRADINGDGKVNITDVNLAINMLLGK